MEQQLDRATLEGILQSENIENLSPARISELIQKEEGISDFIPDGICRLDPRSGDRILYNSARSRRPHDYLAPEPKGSRKARQECPICQGKTTGVLDVAALSEGFTFINKNLFPVLYPHGPLAHFSDNGRQSFRNSDAQEPKPGGTPAHGAHFLQWTSSLHDRDWHNLPRQDRTVVMKRLAALEKKLLSRPEAFLPERPRRTGGAGETLEGGYVSIIKNCGRLGGGSLAHGHQQITLSNVMPRRFLDNACFERKHNEPFSAFILRENPPRLLIRDYGSAALLVPYFMRRPYDLMLVMKDPGKRYLHELGGEEIRAVADGWHEAIRSIRAIMPQVGREITYTVTTSNGPGAGLYFEFLPHTQETGGMEQLGLLICEEIPEGAAERIRNVLAEEDGRA